MSKNLEFIAQVNDQLWLFPYGIGKGAGYLIERATPNKDPEWVVTAAYIGKRHVKVKEDGLKLHLLQLPRNRHD
jgi:hypothetical protein